MIDNVTPKDKWSFNNEVSDAFDNMLERSIPQYQLMRSLVAKLGENFPGDVLDLGCSRGGALEPFVGRERVLGVEISTPMLKAARERFRSVANVEIRECDLREGIPSDLRPGLVLSVLTLQFTPIEYRQSLLSEIYKALEVGGAFLLVEKVLGDGASLDTLLTQTYWDIKSEHGYSREQIRRKALSLEGVLVPVTAKWNEELLRSAGFTRVDCFWRCLNFAGWIGVK